MKQFFFLMLPIFFFLFFCKFYSSSFNFPDFSFLFFLFFFFDTSRKDSSRVIPLLSKAPTNTRTTSNTTSNSVTDSGKEKEVENEVEEGNEDALHALFCEMPEVRTLHLYHSKKNFKQTLSFTKYYLFNRLYHLWNVTHAHVRTYNRANFHRDQGPGSLSLFIPKGRVLSNSKYLPACR